MSHSEKIELFKEATIKFNKNHNLISRKNTDKIIDEAVEEETALTKHLNQYKNILDIGTGSGLPGIPLAIFNENKNIYLSEKNNKKIFFYLGLMISWVGGFLGLIIGFSLLLIQYYSPFLYVPGTSFPYPVSFKLNDIFLVLLTLFILGLISSLWSTLKYKN